MNQKISSYLLTTMTLMSLAACAPERTSPIIKEIHATQKPQGKQGQHQGGPTKVDDGKDKQSKDNENKEVTSEEVVPMRNYPLPANINNPQGHLLIAGVKIKTEGGKTTVVPTKTLFFAPALEVEKVSESAFYAERCYVLEGYETSVKTLQSFTNSSASIEKSYAERMDGLKKDKALNEEECKKDSEGQKEKACKKVAELDAKLKKEEESYKLYSENNQEAEKDLKKEIEKDEKILGQMTRSAFITLRYSEEAQLHALQNLNKDYEIKGLSLISYGTHLQAEQSEALRKFDLTTGFVGMPSNLVRLDMTLNGACANNRFLVLAGKYQSKNFVSGGVTLSKKRIFEAFEKLSKDSGSVTSEAIVGLYKLLNSENEVQFTQGMELDSALKAKMLVSMKVELLNSLLVEWTEDAQKNDKSVLVSNIDELKAESANLGKFVGRKLKSIDDLKLSDATDVVKFDLTQNSAFGLNTTHPLKNNNAMK